MEGEVGDGLEATVSSQSEVCGDGGGTDSQTTTPRHATADTIDQLRHRASWIASFAAAAKRDMEAKEEAFESMMKKEIERLRKEEDLAEKLKKESEVEKASVEAKLKELGEKEEEFESLGGYIEVRGIRVREAEEELGEKRKEVEAKEKEIGDRLEEFRSREKKFEDQVKEFRQKQAEFEVRVIELNVKEREICDNGLTLEFEEKLNEFNRKELNLEMRLAELNKKEKKIDDREKRSKELECKVDEFKAKEAKFKESLRRLEEKEKVIDEKEKRCKLRECNVEESLDKLKLLKKGFQDRIMELKVKEEESLRRLEEKKKKIDEKEKRCKQLEGRVEESLDELKSLEKGYRDRTMELKGKEVKLEESASRLKEEEMEMEVLQNGYRDLLAEVKTKEAKFDESLCQLKEKEKGVEERIKSIIVREEGHRRKEEEFQLKVHKWYDDLKAREIRLLELEEKEKRVEERLKEVEGREEAHQKKLQEFKVQVKQWYDDLEARETNLLKQNEDLNKARAIFVKDSSSLRIQRKEIEDRDKVSRIMELEVQELCNELKSRGEELGRKWEEFQAQEARFEKRFDEFRAKEREIDEKEKKYKELEQKLEESIAKERGFEAKEKLLKELEFKTQDYRKRLEKFQVYDSKYRSLETREKVVDDQLKVIGKRMEDVELREKQLEERLHREAESKGTKSALMTKEKQVEITTPKSESLPSQVKIEPPAASSSSDYSSEAVIRFTVKMNGKDLQIFLNQRSKDLNLMNDEVDSALKLASDPAKLVLDAMEGFYPPHLKKGEVEFEEGVVRKSCVMLLERLMTISPIINPHIRKQAEKLASEWRAKMKPNGDHGWEVLAFSLLLDVYGLACSFKDDEFQTRLGTQYGQTPNSDKEDASELPSMNSPKGASGFEAPKIPWNPTSAALDSHTQPNKGTGGKRPAPDACVDGKGAGKRAKRGQVKFQKKGAHPKGSHEGSNAAPNTFHLHPTCTNCRKKHAGRCRLLSGGCFGCGAVGHRVRDCPNAKCFNCGLVGHNADLCLDS